MHAKHSLLKVLIIDDTAAIRGYIRHILQYLGIEQIQEAEDGASACHLFEHYHPDLVFLDIQLPDTNGKLLLKQFKQQKQDAVIFMVSAYSSVENLQQAMQSGAAAFVVKPFSANRICRLVEPLIA